MAGLTLPSPTTIKGCKRFGCDEAGWTPQLLSGLSEIINQMKPIAKYGILSFDEVKIKEGLVFDPHSGTLVGATDHGEIGSHVLQFFWSSAFQNFSYPLAYFVTTEASAEEIQFFFWSGVYELKKAGLTVIATVFDGSASNRRFQDQICYPNERHLALNIMESSRRNIAIISDPPHLLKKLRSAVFNSGLNEEKKDDNEKPRYTRLMKLDKEDVVWGHIEELAKVKTCGWSVYGITDEALNLNGFTKMKVNLMEKVVNKKVAAGLEEIGHTSTAKYIEKCAALWELLNSKTLVKIEEAGAYMLELYSILDFFKSWKRSVYDSRPEGKPLVDLPPISTLNDLETTINGFGALFRIATECGAGLIPGRINQDGCESWFGHHRQAGGANRNMTVATYGYNQSNLTTSRIASSSYHAAFNQVARAVHQIKPKAGIVEEWDPVGDE